MNTYLKLIQQSWWQESACERRKRLDLSDNLIDYDDQTWLLDSRHKCATISRLKQAFSLICGVIFLSYMFGNQLYRVQAFFMMVSLFWLLEVQGRIVRVTMQHFICFWSKQRQ